MVLVGAGFLAIFSEAPAGLDPSGCSLERSLVPPSFPAHVFGYDLQGCDLLVLTMAGTRNSLLVGVLATILALAVAIPVGTTAGFAGGWVDGLVGRLVDLVTALPIILIQLLIFGNMFGVLFQVIYLVIAVPVVYSRLSGIQLFR